MSLSHIPAILVGIGAAAGSAYFQYAGLVWTVEYMKSRGLANETALTASMFGRFLQILMAFPMAYAADAFGTASVLLIGSLSLSVLGIPLFYLLGYYPTNLLVIFLTYGVGYSICCSTLNAGVLIFVVELFPANVRTVGMGISWNMSMCIFAGLGPMITGRLTKEFPLAPGFLIAGTALLSSTVILIALILQRRGLMELAHVRPHPYFCCFTTRSLSETREVSKLAIATSGDLDKISDAC